MLFTLFLAWIVATTCMTGFSYLFSTLLNENFKEPKLLTDLLGEVFHAKLPLWAGWVVHYATGILFLVLLIAAYSLTNVSISVLWGILFGALLGGLGIFMWKGLYKLAQTNPPTHTRLFHLQLIIAHIFFAIGALAVERWYAPFLKFLIE
jgi:ABC-type antimicrobial peptide transport system permease subunit